MSEAAIEMPATGVLLGLVIAMGIYWAVYSVVLFTLMKVQGWQVGPLALLGSTALATALAQVPIVGPYVGTAVLAVCIWKASGSDFIDSVFSVVIAGALMFAFQIFALTALMGQLDLDRFGEREGDPDEVVEVAATEVWAPSGKEPMLYPEGHHPVHQREHGAGGERFRPPVFHQRRDRRDQLPRRPTDRSLRVDREQRGHHVRRVERSSVSCPPAPVGRA